MFTLFKTKEELKKKITRSFSRKIQIREFEPIESFASYSEEIPADADQELIKRTSMMLYEFAKSDVEQAIIEYKQKLAQERITEQKKQDYKDDNDL